MTESTTKHKVPRRLDRLAKQVLDLRFALDEGLSNKRRYPRAEFAAFSAAVRRYVEVLGEAPLIHRKVASEIYGLRDYLEVERRRVPEDVLWEAERLECLLFNGYDPHFEGHEPPDC